MSNEYFPNIRLNICIEVKRFAKLLDAVADRRTAIDGFFDIYKDGYGVKRQVAYSIDATKMDAGELYIIPSWTDSETGKRLQQRIRVEQQESHLIAGAHVYYFICPVSDQRCKKLYLICNGFRCRKTFRHYYPQQHKSHRERIKTYDGDAPYRAYGKQYYRGKLTPYGKRVQRWENKEEQSSIQLFGDIGKILGIDINKLNL